MKVLAMERQLERGGEEEGRKRSEKDRGGKRKVCGREKGREQGGGKRESKLERRSSTRSVGPCLLRSLSAPSCNVRAVLVCVCVLATASDELRLTFSRPFALFLLGPFLRFRHLALVPLNVFLPGIPVRSLSSGGPCDYVVGLSALTPVTSSLLPRGWYFRPSLLSTCFVSFLFPLRPLAFFSGLPFPLDLLFHSPSSFFLPFPSLFLLTCSLVFPLSFLPLRCFAASSVPSVLSALVFLFVFLFFTCCVSCFCPCLSLPAFLYTYFFPFLLPGVVLCVLLFFSSRLFCRLLVSCLCFRSFPVGHTFLFSLLPSCSPVLVRALPLFPCFRVSRIPTCPFFFA
ncbi:hypothetical protein Tco_0659941 [Tanacetum coccineum]